MNSKDKYAPGLKKGKVLGASHAWPETVNLAHFNITIGQPLPSLITISNVQPPVLFGYSPDGYTPTVPSLKELLYNSVKKQQERK